MKAFLSWLWRLYLDYYLNEDVILRFQCQERLKWKTSKMIWIAQNPCALEESHYLKSYKTMIFWKNRPKRWIINIIIITRSLIINSINRVRKQYLIKHCSVELNWIEELNMFSRVWNFQQESWILAHIVYT